MAALVTNSSILNDLRTFKYLNNDSICSRCDYKNICGGCRVGSLVTTGSMWGGDYECLHAYELSIFTSINELTDNKLKIMLSDINDDIIIIKTPYTTLIIIRKMLKEAANLAYETKLVSNELEIKMPDYIVVGKWRFIKQVMGHYFAHTDAFIHPLIPNVLYYNLKPVSVTGYIRWWKDGLKYAIIAHELRHLEDLREEPVMFKYSINEMRGMRIIPRLGFLVESISIDSRIPRKYSEKLHNIMYTAWVSWRKNWGIRKKIFKYSGI